MMRGARFLEEEVAYLMARAYNSHQFEQWEWEYRVWTKTGRLIPEGSR